MRNKEVRDPDPRSRSFWDLTDQIYRYNPIQVNSDEISMFHGIDERIGVDQFSKLALFWRRFIETTDARHASMKSMMKRKSKKMLRKCSELERLGERIVHDTTAVVEEIALLAEQSATFFMKSVEAAIHFSKGLKR